MIKIYKRIISRILLVELLTTTFIPIIKVKAESNYGLNKFISITANAYAPESKQIDSLPKINNPAPVAIGYDGDHREYMHGLDLLKVGDKTLVVTSINTVNSEDGEWQHDIYSSWIDPLYPNETIKLKKLVSRDEAQEPVSAAVNSSGRILVTAEDAEYNEDLDQTFGVWDSNLNQLRKYGVKLMPPQGGHSGHAAASGNKFLVTFCDGWIDKGGVDNLGTGDNIYSKIIDNNGSTSSLINVSVSSNLNKRDWWPVVAGSDINWLQVWQRYNKAGTDGGTVYGRITNTDGSMGNEFPIYTNNKYYYYDVKYISSIGMYLIIGSQSLTKNSGIAVLVDKSGKVVMTKTGLPSTVREAQFAIKTTGTGATIAYPTNEAGIAVVELNKNSINLKKTVPINWKWDYIGTAGLFSSPNRVLFATNTRIGIKFIQIDI